MLILWIVCILLSLYQSCIGIHARTFKFPIIWISTVTLKFILSGEIKFRFDLFKIFKVVLKYFQSVKKTYWKRLLEVTLEYCVLCYFIDYLLWDTCSIYIHVLSLFSGMWFQQKLYRFSPLRCMYIMTYMT